ncbi:MAG: hypothetical protein J7L44_00140 [Candidatus Diapherotrites archaeon]|nr:hypothetical protein [Candidatus Diapherotrites archaeon]
MKEKVTVTLQKDLLERMKKIRERYGISLSKQVELRMEGENVPFLEGQDAREK